LSSKRGKKKSRRSKEKGSEKKKSKLDTKRKKVEDDKKGVEFVNTIQGGGGETDRDPRTKPTSSETIQGPERSWGNGEPKGLIVVRAEWQERGEGGKKGENVRGNGNGARETSTTRSPFRQHMVGKAAEWNCAKGSVLLKKRLRIQIPNPPHHKKPQANPTIKKGA